MIWAVNQPQKGSVPNLWHIIREKLAQENQIESAITFLLKTFETYPENTIIPHQIERLMVKGDFLLENRFQYVNRLLEVAPDNIEVLSISARMKPESDASQSQQLWLRGWKIVQKIQGKPNTSLMRAISSFTTGYAQFLRKQDKYEDAYTVVEQVRTQWGIENWDLNLERAINLARLGSYEDAYSILKKLDDIRPDNPIVLDQIGVCLRQFGELDDAIIIYQRKVNLYPEDAFGWQGLGKTHFELGNYDEALEIFNKLLVENPNDIDAILAIVQIYRAKGEYDQAKEYFEKINPELFIERGWNPFFYERQLAELERQRRQQQVELEEAKKLAYLGMMATATAHELNQPIGIIRAATSAAVDDIKEGYFHTDEMQPLLEQILAQTERLNAIFENFRKFARGERTHREKVKLNSLVQHTTTYFTEQFNHRNIVLTTQLWSKRPQPQPIAWANPFQLEEVLINLLSNARDAVEGRENAHVWVKTWRRKGGSCGFSVEDNGPGLSPEYQKQMFVPFVSTKSTEKGTGLGLYISRRIIDELGGSLRYQDRTGGGACFTVHLPPLKG